MKPAEFLNELSNDTLASYKKKAGEEATASDKAGDTKKADKRFSGIVKATKKQFANDEKKVDEAYNNYHANRTGFARGPRDDERHDLDVPSQQIWGLKINGKVWSKDGKYVTFTSKQAALNARNSILKNKPDLEIGLVTQGGSPASGAQSKTDDNFLNYLAQRKAGQQEQLDEIIDPSTALAQGLRYIGRKFATAFPWLAVGGVGAGLAASGLMAPIVASMGGVTSALSALSAEMAFSAGMAGTYAAPSIIQTIKDLFAADENSIQAGIKRWVEKYVGDDNDVQEFMLVHSKASYEGKPGFRWRAKEWPVKMSKDQAEAFLEKNDKMWLDYEKQKAADAEKQKADAEKPASQNVDKELDEDLHKWFKEKWVRFGPDGKIRGACARGDDSEGKPKCLPQAKAHALGKKGRASAGARKRREDPNPERSGKAINVNTKKKSNESVVQGRDEGNFVGDTPVNLGGVAVKNLGIGDIVSYLGQKAKIVAMSKTGNTSRITIPSGMGGVTKDVLTKDLKRTSLSEAELDEACWKGYHKEGNKKMFGKTYPNCVKNTNEDSLNEFAPDGFNGGDDDEGFSPEIAKMAQEDGFTKGAGLADGATLERAMAINYWHSTHGGMYKQYFAKGFEAGRMDKIRHNNKQYNLNLKLMKDGSIRRGQEGVAEGSNNIEVGDKITWWYNKFHPNYEGIVRKVQGNTIIVYSPRSGEMYQLTKDDIRSHEKKGVAEGSYTKTPSGDYVNQHTGVRSSTAPKQKKKRGEKTWAEWDAIEKSKKEKQQGVAEDDAHDVEQRMISKIAKHKEHLAQLKKTDPEAYKREMEKHKQTNRIPPVSTFEGHSESCPHCGGEMVSEELMNEKKDACYYKVKNRYKVWPSAYASGALVKCRKAGASNWGNGGKSNESIEEDQLDEKWTKKYKDSINCSNPKGFSQKAHCAGKQKNESAIMKGLK